MYCFLAVISTGAMQAVSAQEDSATGRWLLDIVRSADTIGIRQQALVLGARSATTSDLVALYTPELDASLRGALIEIYSSHLDQVPVLDLLGDVARRDPDAELRKKAVGHVSSSQNPHAAEVLQRVVEAP